MDLAEISDRLEIEALLTRYTRAIDTGEWDLLDEVFTPDADIDYTASGGIAAPYTEVKPWLAEMLPIFPRRMHTLGQVDSRWTATRRRWRRTSTTRWCSPRRRVRLLVEFGGIYHHDLVRTPDGWRSRRWSRKSSGSGVRGWTPSPTVSTASSPAR